MAYENTMESQSGSSAVGKSLVTSYDLGYEHSLQHYIEVKCMVEEAEGELSSVSTPHLAQAKAAYPRTNTPKLPERSVPTPVS